VRFASGQPVAVTVTVYLRPAHFKKVDIDNVLKHVLDALQGVLAGEGKKRAKPHKRVVLNDNLVWSATVEKRPAPRKRSTGGGWMTVRPWRNARG
jgi:Holliday junction resolvase RusA-like endonuclease